MLWPLIVFLFQVSRAQYCASGPLTSADANLGKVLLAGDSSAISDSSNCPGYIGVRDLTSLIADLHAGGTYTLQYNVTTCGGSFPTVSGAWIDYDQDNSFDSEEALFPFNSRTPTAWVTGSFVVPTDAKTGTTRMRVQVQETSSTNPLDPCARFAYGGTKDFSISISSAPPASYCPSGPILPYDSNLGAVTLSGNKQTIADSTNCPGVVGPRNLTGLVADLSIGGSYTLQYDVTTCGSTYPTVSGAWIDWNGDSIFESTETLGPFYSTTQADNLPITVTRSFAVPSNALVGNTRLRVQVQETTSASLNPCFMFAYGGTKDFSIAISSPQLCSSGPTTSADTNLGPVTLLGDSTNIADNTDCPGYIGVRDLTSLVADVHIGGSYILEYGVTTCGGRYPSLSGAWIDYNQDSVFESDELLFPFSQAAPTSVVTGTFVVPSTAILGNTTMRVQVQETVATTLDPCADFAHGGTKDFTIFVGLGTK